MKNILLVLVACTISAGMNAQAPNWKWAKQSIGDGHDYGIAIDADPEGNSYITGTFQPPWVIIGSDTLTASTSFNSGFYVAKYDRNGNPLWARTITGSASMNSTGISLNSTGDELIVTGYYKSVGYISFGSDSISSGSSIFESYIAKYDTAGTSVWSYNAGTAAWNGQIHFDVKLDAIGNSYVGGTFEDTIYLKKFDPSGTELWNSKFSGGTFNTFFWSLDVTPSGESVVAGYFANTSLLFDTVQVPLNSNGYTIVLVKSDAQGNVLWAKNDGQIASLYKPDIALDASDNIYVTGFFNGTTCMFGSTTLYNQGADDVFLVKFNSSGIVQWAQSAGGINYDLGIGIATDQHSNCYITGMFRTFTWFGPFYLFNNGDPDIYVAKYDENGTVLWAKNAGGSLVEDGVAIALDDSTNGYVTGSFTSPTLAFDNIFLQNSSPQFNPYDLFIAKLSYDSLTGIAEPGANTFVVYPNPLVMESVIVLKNIGEHTLELYDIRGSLLRRLQFSGNQVVLRRENLSPGTYVLRVVSEKNVSETVLVVE